MYLYISALISLIINVGNHFKNVLKLIASTWNMIVNYPVKDFNN